MKKCVFFGHRDCPLTMETKIDESIQRLIEVNEVDVFYVGNQGQFDSMVKSALRRLEMEYPHILWYVVLAYVPTGKWETALDHTLLPEGIERVPKKFAISFRNRWMLQQADYIIAYVNRSFGGAAEFVKQGKKMNKNIINLADTLTQSSPSSQSG